MTGMPPINLPCWLSGKNATALKNVATRWWDTCEGYARLPLTTFEPLTCEIAFVDLLAFQRGIDRTACESEHSYRLRVHHALRNAQAAGTPAGMNAIFRNLELPEADYLEQSPDYEWDTTEVTFTARKYAALHCEIDFALKTYWRTCRRYHIVQEVKATTHYGAGNVLDQDAVSTDTHKLNPVPFRPASAAVAVGNVTDRDAVNTASHHPSPVPFRPLWAAIAVGGLFNFTGTTHRTFAL